MGDHRNMGISFEYKASVLTERRREVDTEGGVWVRSRKELILESIFFTTGVILPVCLSISLLSN